MALQTTPEQNEQTGSIRLKRFQDVKSKYIGAEGTAERAEYEVELRAEIIALKIKEFRKARHMTQQELGEKIAQVSRLENSTANITLETLQKVFQALGARVKFEIETITE